jgi:sugar lactone lactonase YvrE
VQRVLRMVLAILAVAALAGGGAAALADRGPGGGGERGGQATEPGDDNGGHGAEPGDDNGGQATEPGDDNGGQANKPGDDNGRHDNEPGDDNGGHDNEPGDDNGRHGDHPDKRGDVRVFELAGPSHGNPEGVAFDKRTRAFFVSSTGDGTIYRGTLDQRTLTPFIAGAQGRSATGLKVFRGRLYVAGAATGTISVYDIATGNLLALFDTKGGNPAATFINDLVVTRRGDVFATDSARPVIYHLSAAEIAAGTPAGKPIDPSDVISTAPEIPFDASPGAFNLNGIAARGDGRRLIVVHSGTGQLFSIDVGASGRSIREIKVDGGPFPNGDGLLFDRGRLLVVQNVADGFPNGVVSFVKLRHGGGTVQQRRTDGSFRTPSTIARADGLYLVVNPDFALSRLPFTVTGLPR